MFCASLRSSVRVARALRPARLLSASAARAAENVSSCAAGTVLNLKVRKSGDEPVALADAEYPDWLWDCLDKKKQDDILKQNDFMKWRRKQLNRANTARINNNNFLSKM